MRVYVKKFYCVGGLCKKVLYIMRKVYRVNERKRGKRMNDEQIKRVAEAIDPMHNGRSYSDRCKNIERAKRAIEAMEPQWQSIETAPKDGSLVDVYIGGNVCERYTEAYYSEAEQCWCWNIEGTGRRVVFTETPPTHWMPLPQPPKGE